MSYTDFIRPQNDVAHVLLSDEWLNNVNIVTRDRIIADESKLPDKTLALEVLAYITGRNGRHGCGVIIEKPGIDVENPNLPGPEMFLRISLLIVEEPLANNSAALGTLLPADQVAQRCLESLHGLAVEGMGELWADRNAIVPTEEVGGGGLREFRVNLRARLQRAQSERPAFPEITENAGTISLSHTDASAVLYYTTDGTYPGPSNTKATRYADPFAVEDGTVIRAAAYVTGQTPGHATQTTYNA